MATLTPEQLQVLIEMSDIGGMEDEQTRMIKMAEALRNAGNIRGNDVGANIGRAAYGIGGAVADYKAKQQNPAISEARQGTLARLLRGMKKPLPNVPQLGVPSNSPMPNPDEEYPYE